MTTKEEVEILKSGLKDWSINIKIRSRLKKKKE